MSGLGPITDLSLADLRRRRSAKWSWYDDDVLPAWVAEMDFPVAAPVREALAAAVARDDLGYASTDAARLGPAFAEFAARRHGWEVDPAQVTPLNDVVAGLIELVRVLTEPGDGVLINPPVYHPFFHLITDAGRRVVEAPLADGRDFDLDAVEAAFAAGTRVLILCNPHNPTGGVLGRAELERVAEIAAAHDGWVLADEIHAPIVFAGAEHVPFLSVSEAAAERGIVLTSASKAFNTAGLKCAVAITASATARAAVARTARGLRALRPPRGARLGRGLARERRMARRADPRARREPVAARRAARGEVAGGRLRAASGRLPGVARLP